MIYRFETTLDIPDNIPSGDILKKLALPLAVLPYAICFSITFVVTKGIGQTLTTPAEHPEILYVKVTATGLDCLKGFAVESFISLTEKQSNLLEGFVGLEEEIETACWEYLEGEEL